MNMTYNLIVKNLFLLAIIAIQFVTIGCNNPQGNSAQEEAQTQYYRWTDEDIVTEIEIVRKGDVFYGFYICAGEGILIMGMIDKDENLTGVSSVTFSDEIFGTLSGKITGNKFNASWSPTPMGMEFYNFQQLEMTQQKELTEYIKEYLDKYSFMPETPYTPVTYGYHIGEGEARHICINKDEKGKAKFTLRIEQSGAHNRDLTIRGTVTLDGNTFRYKEQNCEFEVNVYNGFIIVKTISGALDGIQVDGVYPAPSRDIDD